MTRGALSAFQGQVVHRWGLRPADPCTGLQRAEWCVQFGLFVKSAAVGPGAEAADHQVAGVGERSVWSVGLRSGLSCG